MSDFERLTDDMRIFASPDAVTREWECGYQAGKTRARYEVLAVIVALCISSWYSLGHWRVPNVELRGRAL